MCFALSVDQIINTSCAFLRIFSALILCVHTSTVPPCRHRCLLTLPGKSSPQPRVHISLSEELTDTQSQFLCGSPRCVWVTADRTVISRPAKAACFPACDISPRPTELFNLSSPKGYLLQEHSHSGLFFLVQLLYKVLIVSIHEFC